jgi:hypothetical protein
LAILDSIPEIREISSSDISVPLWDIVQLTSFSMSDIKDPGNLHLQLLSNGFDGLYRFVSQALLSECQLNVFKNDLTSVELLHNDFTELDDSIILKFPNIVRKNE